MTTFDYKALAAAAVESEDLTVDKSFERELPAEGSCLLRLRDYIETGRHKSKNPQHKPGLRVKLVFEISSKKHLIDIDGKKVPTTIQVQLNKGATSGSGYKKLFKCMNAAHDNKFTHFVQMVGQGFVGKIYHKKSTDGKNTYANLDLDGAWSLQAPYRVDPVEDTREPIAIRELDKVPKVFLWENESVSDEMVKGMWESIYIEGTYERIDDTTKEKVTVSKNRFQEEIMQNLEWEGSTTQALTQEHVVIDELMEEPDDIDIDKDAINSDGDLPSMDD